MIPLRQLHHRFVFDGKIRQFEEQDLIDILNETAPGMEELNARTARTRMGHGPALTFTVNDLVVACFGATIYWKGMAEAWLACSSLLKSYAFEVVIWTRDILDWLQLEFHLRRLQADVLSINKVACRFVEHFGFVAEGVMRSYDIFGRDMIRYARIREDIDGRKSG
jgi:hypothetical protein